ncbi:MAG: hypothetical protein ACT4O3_05380, partial [Elusimicrobiota bacterium]
MGAPIRAQVVNGTISSDTLWTSADSPILLSDHVIITNGAVLTVEAGVTVKAEAGVNLTVQSGALRVLGSSAQTVIFTSIKDDAADGSDSNADGGASTPAPGDWGQIVFEDGVEDAATLLEHASIRFGRGLALSSARPTFRSLSLTSNSGAAIHMDPLSMIHDGQGLSAASNGVNGITVHGTLTGSSTWSVRSLAYVMPESYQAMVGDGGQPGHLTIEPGVVIKAYATNPIRVRTGSSLTAVGTESAPI